MKEFFKTFKTFEKVVDGSLLFLDPTIKRDGDRGITRVHRTPTQTQNIPFRYIITLKTISMIHQTSFFFLVTNKQRKDLGQVAR